VGHQRNKGGNQKVPEVNETESTTIRTYGTQQSPKGKFMAMSA
jgi:hypothetical protein